MKRSIVVVLMVLFVLACGRSPYEGYKAVGDEVYLRLLAIGDGEVVPGDSDSVVVRLRLGMLGDDVGGIYSTERSYLVKDIRSGALKPIVRRMHVGDSLSVIARSNNWPWEGLVHDATVELPDTGMVQGELSLRSLRTPAMMRAEAERLKEQDPLGYELRLIAAYLERERKPFSRWGTSDVYYHISGTAVDTNAVVAGDLVSITYQGRSLEGGVLFDDTQRNGGPFTFTYGDKDQVIQGLGVAIHLLREGQEGTFIFPSLYAFGPKGIPGVLEGDLPVVYTVRLQRVTRKANPALR